MERMTFVIVHRGNGPRFGESSNVLARKTLALTAVADNGGGGRGAVGNNRVEISAHATANNV